MGENERVDLSQQFSSVENRGALRETFVVTKQKPQRLLCNNPSILEREGRGGLELSTAFLIIK
jgi:hypothetical protein